MGARSTVAQNVTSVVKTVTPTKPSTLTAMCASSSRSSQGGRAPTPIHAPKAAPTGRNAAATGYMRTTGRKRGDDDEWEAARS